MKALQEVSEHWGFISPILTPPDTEEDYDALVAMLDEILDADGADETHPLAVLADRVGDLISQYDDEHYVIEVEGFRAIQTLMDIRGFKQKDLGSVASQGVMSQLIAGERPLNLNHIRKLSDLFNVPEQVFISRN